MILYSREHGEILLKRYVEDNRITLASTGAYGSFRFCEIRDEHFSLIYCSLNPAEDLALSLFVNKGFLGFLIVLGNDVTITIARIMKEKLIQRHQYGMISVPQWSSEARLHKNISYAFGVLRIELDYLQMWVSDFPSVGKLIFRAEHGIPSHGGMITIESNSEIIAIAEHLLRQGSDMERGKVYRKSKVEDALLMVLKTHEDRNAILRLSEDDRRKLYEVQGYLLDHLHEKISLPVLAKKIGMSKSKLKRAFKKEFGLPVFRYLYEERMSKARTLILETKEDLQDIAAAVSYNLSSFSSAFKRKYGYPPSDLRDNRIQPESW
jgi:AraC-like DNA-binding protein